MTTIKSTGLVTVREITTTPGENYLTAQGTALFAGDEMNITAYGRAAEELAANRNSDLTAEIEILGGSKNPVLKLNRVISVAAPAIEVADERIEQVRNALKLKSKMTKPQIVKAVNEAMSILES